MYRFLPHRVLSFILILIFFSLAASAQSPARAVREAQWDAYQLPAGKFTRFVDKQKGFSFRVPADWKQQPGQAGGTYFKGESEAANVACVADNIPDGLGVAAYVSSFMQGVRNQPIRPESLVIRRVRYSGLEWREVTYELVQASGESVHQTVWFTAAGPRAYSLILSVQPDQLDKFGPIFKRIVSSVRIGGAGHWDDEYETLRANFTKEPNSEVKEEAEAAQIADSLRSGRESLASAADRIAELFARSPETAIDLITDADPQVRTAAIAGLGKSTHPKIVDLMIWALTDNDVFASSTAAQILARHNALPAIKSKLAVLADNPAAVVRAGVTLGEPAARELMEVMLRSDNPKEHLAALQLALISKKFELTLPFAELLASSDPGMPHLLGAVLERHPSAGAAEELLKFLRTDNELWAVRVLGAFAPAEIEKDLNKRSDEVRALVEKSFGTPIKKARTRTETRTATRSVGVFGGPPPPPAPAQSTPPVWPNNAAEWKKLPEKLRRVFLQAELHKAVYKIKYRGAWDQAKSEEERKRIKSELEIEGEDVFDRPQLSSRAEEPVASLDAAKLPNLKDAPTTGETIFPKEAFSYVMAPDFAATMERLDSALSGVQMATVRDQMTFAFILKALKARLASQVGADATGDASKATGIDLKSPIAMASWFAPGGKGENSMRSALTVRVSDRARFERLLASYQQDFGDFDRFIQVSAGLARFAGVFPGALPVILAYSASAEARDVLARRLRSRPTESKIPSLKPIAHVTHDNVLPLTTIIRPIISETSPVKKETICIAYLGDTAVVSTSRAAIADLVAAGASGETITRGEAFPRSRSEKGELIFFSRLDTLLKSMADLTDDMGGKDEIAAFINALGIESGALQLTGNSWETVFKIGLAGNDFTKSFSHFKVEQLAAPRELLPRSTILYAGAIVDPPLLYSALKSLEKKDKQAAAKTGRATVTVGGEKSGGGNRSKEIDAAIENLVVPNMQGEIAAALVSLEPIFNGATKPALALAVKLKNGELAEAFRSGKLWGDFYHMPKTTALGSPVAALGDTGDAPFVVVTDAYLILADSVETLRLLEAKEKLSSSRDYARSTKDAPTGLAVFATYNLESASDEASKVLAGKSMQQALVFSNAVNHAFHSQRAFLALDKDGLAGRLSVAFDREGRYSVGDLAKSAGEIDIANAMIEPKGLSVLDSTRVESMTLKVGARAPGFGPRLRDDIAKFDFQRAEASGDTTVVVTTSARHIPDKLTISLPVAGAEFDQFLVPTARINSEDPRVAALAQQIAGKDKDGRSVARKIGEWTYGNLKWKKVQSDTIETLASREADCLEHSELYVALARSLGLPARVVSGAALSGGAFGAHAWVEIYLGKWVEIDPTWGLMDHVDATHLRFDGDAFVSYAMLNQLELEIASVRRTVADYQRDPIRLAREFSLDPETSELAFDLSLAAEQALGNSRWSGLDDKQRATVVSAFEKTVKEICDGWKLYTGSRPRVLQSDIKTDRASVTLLRNNELLRLTLALRDGAWFITEHELVDDAVPEFADAIKGAIDPAGRRAVIYETSVENSVKHLDKLIAREGEKPELLLLKSRVLETKEFSEALEARREVAKQAAEKDLGEAGKAEAGKPEAGKNQAPSVSAIDVYKEIANRWPDFAPGRWALAHELFSSLDPSDANKQPNKESEKVVAEFLAYTRLAPYDPRPWQYLAYVHERTKKLEEAVSAFEKAIELDREYLDYQTELIRFHLRHHEAEKARSAFARILKTGAEIDDVVDQFHDAEDGFEPEYAGALETLLLAFPKELEGSAAGWELLAELQEAQKKSGVAIKSIQRALAIDPSVESYVYLSQLYRSEKRYAESLGAADQGVKLEEDYVLAHFERACSLARLGRKTEAMAALKKMFEIDPDTYFDTEEADLQALSAMPEFKAMKEKMTKQN
jgi:transglutaminase-like putative cysteine protease